ncbi:MAG: HlyD family efflux transporter periplasmic adaptor subunit [Ruminococcus sp.]|nr:HlyD family efflux transporter periplasmic adaptor subunit [Ruminococcus sp.]
MDGEIYLKIKKGNQSALKSLCDKHLKRSWFICYYLTMSSGRGSPLLIKAWKKTLTEISASKNTPKEGFEELLYCNILKLYTKGVSEDPDFEDIPAPHLNEKYKRFEEEITLLEGDTKTVYIFSNYGNLRADKQAEILGLTPEEVSSLLKQANKEIKEKLPVPKSEWTKNVQLFTSLRDTSNSGFADIAVEPFLRKSLNHEVGSLFNKTVTPDRKEQQQMKKEKVSSRPTTSSTKGISKRNKRIIKYAVIAAIVIVVVILGIIFIPKIFGSSDTATSVTTYTVDTVTTGSVDTTISGSGTLSPISQTTLSTNMSATVTAVNYEVGDSVDEGNVIAKVEYENGETESFKAPYDCVIIELPVTEDDELTDASEIAMVMGTDGFTMGIAVDETDISTIEIGQDVTFTIDALGEEYEGSVTAISYNGTTSGSTTAYQITATVDYVEGVYPGMSASAEIVIESSGEGLIVPVSAVRTSGDDSYIYLAPSDAEDGDEYSEDEIDESSLTKVTVETGTSDGSNIIVESDDLEEDDLIVIVTITSTQTGSTSDDSDSTFGGRGDMGGGMDFGDFDFEDFDPSTAGGGMGGMNGKGE